MAFDSSIYSAYMNSMGDMSRSIQHGAAAWGQKREQQKKEASEASTLRKLLSTRYGEDKDRFSTMSLADLRGELEGRTLQSAEEDAAIKRQLHQAQIAGLTAENQERNRRAEALQAFQARATGATASPQVSALAGMATSPQFNPLQNWEQYAQMDATPPAAPDPGTLMQYAMQAGMDPQDMQRLAASLDKFSETGAGSQRSPYVFEDPKTRRRYVVHGNQILPSGQDPDLAVQERTLSDGSIVVQNANGGITVVNRARPELSQTLMPYLDANGQPVHGVYVNPNNPKVPIDLRSQLDKTMGQDWQTSPAAPSGGEPGWLKKFLGFGGGGGEAAGPAPAVRRFNPETGRIE